MFTLTLTPTGTVDSTVTEHPTKADAGQALAAFARGAYEIHGDGFGSGTLTTKCGRVNQAAYSYTIRFVEAGK